VVSRAKRPACATASAASGRKLLQLRGSTSPLPVRVYWPGQAAPQPVPLLVFVMLATGRSDADLSEAVQRSPTAPAVNTGGRHRPPSE